MRAVVAGIGLVGIFTVGATCPGLFALVPREYRRRYSRKSFSQAARRLEGEYYAATRQGDTWKFSLTKKGRMMLSAYEIGGRAIKRANTWDGKWRVLIFDIPEKDRLKRDRIRRTLMTVGFHRLQDSVWAFPYDCRQVMDLLRIKHHVIGEALYLVVESLDGDRWLRKHFRLPKKR